MHAILAAIPDTVEAAAPVVAVVAGLATAANHDPHLRAELSETLLARPHRALREALDRAVTRGAISAGQDLDLLAEVMISMNLLQVLLGGTVDREHVQRVLRGLVYPLVTAWQRDQPSSPNGDGVQA